MNFTYKRVGIQLYNEAVEESVLYYKKNMNKALVFLDDNKVKIFNYAAKQNLKDGYVAEFGTWNGRSANIIAEKIKDKTLYCFSALEGNQEDWSGFEWFKGAFKIEQAPELKDNCEFIEGYFKDTLPGWLEENKDEFALMHIDCDTYQSTKEILELSGPERINSGTVIIFGEYFGYPNWQEHQYKAWQEFVAKNNINYEYLAINVLQVAVKVL
jgi:predicted O-methyltransferase YrrM